MTIPTNYVRFGSLMADVQTLKNPPIVEAMLDVQVIFPKGVELEKLAALHEQFQEGYPKKEEMRMVQFNVQQQIGQTPVTSTHDHGILGYRFLSVESKQIIQCRRNGFTFNRLAPYGCWEDFIGVARGAWESYQTAFPDAQIVRIGVRYINRILVPLREGKVDLEEYLTVGLPGPKIEGLSYLGFMAHSTCRDNETGLDINWVLARQGQNDSNSVPIVLDIDVYALGTRAQQANPTEVWEIMRNLKNRLFFSSFTSKGLDLFR
jgi:uncharacterized protein (TIGR04255 family)